jgi:DNA-binding FadR family transcriptional regulator
MIWLGSKINEVEFSGDMMKVTEVLKTFIGHLKQYPVGSEIPSEKELERTIGYSLAVTRETLIALRFFGFIKIQRGKNSIVLKEFSLDFPSAHQESLVNVIRTDTDYASCIVVIRSCCNIGGKLPGERRLKVMCNCGRQKVREILIGLECLGFLERSHGKNRKLLKELPLL